MFARQTVVSPFVRGKELMFGVSVTAAVIEQEKSRNELLNELVEFPDGGFYLRIHHSGDAAYSQYGDRAVIRGLREVVTSLHENDRDVTLPQLGLLGWAMTAFGADAFGSGIEATTQRCCEPRGGGGSNSPLERYFVPQLLSYVLRSDIPQLQGVGAFETCRCPFCATLLQPRRPWDHNQAGQHFLWSCCQLASEMPTDVANRAEALQTRLAAAAELRDALQSAGRHLDAQSEPKHLASWLEALT